MQQWPQALRTAVGICLASPFPTSVWWGPERITIYNDASALLLGQRHPGALGAPARATWPDLWPAVANDLERVVGRGESVIRERVRFVTARDGAAEEKFFTCSFSPIPDDVGGVGGLLQVCTDETARVLAERERDRLAAAVRESEARFRAVFDASRDAKFVYTPDGTIVEANAAACEMYGVSREQLIGLHAPDVIHPDALPEFREFQRVALEGREYRCETTDRRGDGSAFPIEASGIAFQYDGRTHLMSVIRDITERRRAEAALREAEGRYRAIFEAVTDGLMINDPTGKVIEVNAAACRMHGYTREEFLATPPASFVHPDDLPLLARFVEATARGEAFRCEARDLRKDGTAFPVEVRGTSFVHNGKRHVLGIVRDITERRQAEAAAREWAEWLRAVFEQSTAGIAQLDLAGRFILVNQWFCDLVGYSREELLNLRMQDLTHPDDVGPNLALIDHAMRDGRGYRMEKRYVRKDGSVVWIDLSGNVIRGADDKPRAVFGVVTDVTERKQAEAALRAATERWELAVNATQDGIWDWDLAAGSVYWSPRCKQMLGYADHELRIDFDAVKDLIHPDDRDRAWAETRRHLEGGTELFQSEYRLRHRDGSYRWVLARGRVIRGPAGEPVRMLGSHTDITDRKAAAEQLQQAKEEAERASRAKDEFIAVLSHELRTPLTPVLLTVSLLEASPGLPQDLREDVATIRRNVELESRLISDLLDLTRISRGKLQLEEQDVDLHRVLRSAIDICQREASARLAVDLRAGNHTVRGDSTRLQQVFWNLINNAQKFTPPAGTITVRSVDVPGEAGESPGGAAESGATRSRVRVEVSDDGEGIDPAVLPKLFTAFEQGEVRAKRQFAGLGLGLAICKKLVEAQGGTISARSEGRGKGAAFVVELPTVRTPAPAQGPRAMQAPPGAVRPLRVLRVLLVEDNEPTLRVMTKLLEQLGHQVTGAPTMAGGLAAARRESFDLLLSDLGLPDGSGLDLMRELRQQFDGRAVALTGYGMEDDVRRSRDAGFAAHLTKPIDLQALEEAVRKVMGEAKE